MAGVDRLHRGDDVETALLDVVIGPDGDGLDLGLRSHHMFQRRTELAGKASVGDEYKPYHSAPPCG
ncbi:hypothetical protein GCM10028812_34020 [Ancylobacter sonchi]